METTARNRTIGGIVIAAIIMVLLLVLFSCTVNSDPVGYSRYYQDESGYVVPVEVSKDAPIPPDWTCYAQESRPEKLACDVRVEGAQGPDSETLTEQEVRDLVWEEVERIRKVTEAEPKQEPDHSPSAPQRDWFDWSMALTSWIGIGIAALTLILTQRKRLPALFAGTRRLVASIHHRFSTRDRTAGIGPGPLYHSRSRRPARRPS